MSNNNSGKELRKQIVKCFNIEKIEDYEDSYISEDEQDIEYFDTSAVIDRIEKLISSKVNEEVVKELESLPKEYMKCRHCKGAHLIASVPENTIQDRIRTLKEKA